MIKRTPHGRRALARRLLRALVISVTLACALTAQASAHAVLQHTSPHQNAALTTAPSSVRLDFNEPVEVSFGALRVYDRRGDRVDAGTISYPNGERDSVTIALRDDLGRGVYTTTYRVVSADGHPVSGGFAFGVGEQVTVDRDTPQVADLLARSSAGPAVEATYGIARGLHYAALLLLIGAIGLRGVIAPLAAGPTRWPDRLLLGAAAAGLLCALAAIALQGALGAGVPLSRALDGDVLRGSLETRTGHAWLLRAALWAFLTVFLALYRDIRRHSALAVMAAPIVALVATLPYAGHADTQTPKAALVPADVVHVIAAGAWLGGLVLLLVCFWPRRHAPVDQAAATATARFSRVALPAIVALVAAGSIQAWFYLGTIGALFSSTYGWALVAKIALLAAIVAIASANRRRARRLTTGDSGHRLRRSMRAEVALAALALAATATLVRAAPPATLDRGPVVRELNLGPMRLQLDLEPATVGPNDYHLYLFDRRTGAQINRVEELKVQLIQRDKNIGPITLEIPRKGPAHYELRNTTLGVSGTWQATITARVSDYDEHAAKTTFNVRP